MHRSFGLAFFAAAAVIGWAPAAGAATMLNVGASNACGENGCFSDSQRVFTRTWSAGDFSGPISISHIAIDKAMLGSLANYAVRVSFVDSLGNTVSNWGNYTLAVLSGRIVTVGGQPLTWDMANGDLTLKLELLLPDKSGGFGGGGGGGGGGMNFAASSGGPASFVTSPDPAPLRLPGPSVASLPSAFAVPEPGAWALMLTGFFGAGAALRGHRRRLAT